MDIIKNNDFGYEDIKENIDDMFIQKLQIQKELPLDCQVDPNSFFSTLKNLYHWYLDKYPYCDLPDCFFEDYIGFSAEKLLIRANLYKCILQLKESHRKNKKN
jgi:hypothetical protein